MDTILIRDLIILDIEDLISLIQLVHRTSYRGVFSEKLIESMCKKYTKKAIERRMGYTHFFVAENTANHKLIGVIGLKESTVRGFYVHPDFQRKGVGSLLYKHLEKIARDAQLSELNLESSPLGTPIYLHFGFIKIEAISKEREGVEYTNIVMRKALT